ncbi:MAG: hypothetical protein K2H38_06865 [Muribaculaceae bacterium]|nr:hypothetical protein [Muribaculaceae bacterium]MDE6553173.1 hypothetical protein [Muribaculaceae bacterium]
MQKRFPNCTVPSSPSPHPEGLRQSPSILHSLPHNHAAYVSKTHTVRRV